MNNVTSPRNDDESIEQEIQRKGKTAPRVTPADIKAAVVAEHYFTAAQGAIGCYVAAQAQKGRAVYPDEVPYNQSLDMLTFCVLVLRNGFTVTGESACASPENFDAEIGKSIARQNAEQKIWPLEGYLLKQRLHDVSGPGVLNQPPATDAHVAIGSTRVSDGAAQTGQSLAEAQAAARPSSAFPYPRFAPAARD